jgi:glycine oxidase
MGVAIAVACQQAGKSVVLIEADQLGSGATGGAAGLITPEALTDVPALLELGRAGLDGWRRLQASVPGGVGFVDNAWLGLLSPDGASADAPSPAAVVLEPDAVARLLPGLAESFAGHLIEGQGRVNPLRAVAHIAEQLHAIATGVRALAVEVKGGAIHRVETTAGTLSPGAVIFATGVPPQLRGLEMTLPADFVKGHILATEPAAVTLPGTVEPVATQLGNGRLIIGGTLDVGDDSTTVRELIVNGMMAYLATKLPSLAGLEVSHAWCCFRPHHPDGLPVIDRLTGIENGWFTSGHYRTGILMAPATAEILVDWLQTGERPPLAAPFGAGRFATA